MSDILIKNVDIPDDNPLVLMLTSDGLVCEKTGSMFHVADALWKELPPHGDLIDRDELLSDMKQRGEDGILNCNDPIAVVTMILSARTFLEATNE